MSLSLRTFLLAAPCAILCHAQTTLILQPDASTGKDAVLHGLPTEVNTNWGYIDQWCASAWTFNGSPGVLRAVVDFDLSTIPVGAQVLSAELSLYAWDNTGGFGQHSELSGSNAAWLMRITDPWNENTVTWNSAPASTIQNQVSLAGTSNPNQDYTDIDVTAMVQDMVSDPANGHGFMLRLQNESYYRRMNFCTSEHPDNASHPKLVVTYLQPAVIDTCITLPNSGVDGGKDAVLHGMATEVNTNYGFIEQWCAAAWTFNGTPGVLRGVIGFDLSSIPAGAQVSSADLSLYAWNSSSGFGPHSDLSGSNATWLQRITSPWNENTVTWNTAPSVTTSGQVALAGTSDPAEDYLDIDVTGMVQNMVDDPANSHGFMLRLQDETYYRRMNFGTSDHANSNKHPRLEVCYSVGIGMAENAAAAPELFVYPNPAVDRITVDLGSPVQAATLRIVDMDGRIVRSERIAGQRVQLDIAALANGSYHAQVIGAEERRSQRFIVLR